VAVAVGRHAIDPARYRAEAVLAVTRPDVALGFDERFAEPETNPAFPYQVSALRAYVELAGAPAVAREVAARLHPDLRARPDALTEQAAALADRIRFEARADGSLLAIAARAVTPDAAAQLANTYAEVLSERMAAVFAARPDVTAVTVERDRAATALAEAEDALVAYRAQSRLMSLEVELRDLQQRYAASLQVRDRLESVARTFPPSVPRWRAAPWRTCRNGWRWCRSSSPPSPRPHRCRSTCNSPSALSTSTWGAVMRLRSPRQSTRRERR
jgi:hypothetical protein